jgi:MFS superfamily sulfate permease-like transporter
LGWQRRCSSSCSPITGIRTSWSRRHRAGDVIRIQLSEDVSFLNRASIMRTLNAIPEGARVEIDAGRTVFMDHDVYEIIRDFEQQAGRRRIEVTLSGFESVEQRNDSVRRIDRAIRRERRRLAKRLSGAQHHSPA